MEQLVIVGMVKQVVAAYGLFLAYVLLVSISIRR